ncbi:MAG: hypothetical protein GY827_04285 [Cytophagales bacterium]|nr:hypothetical protein [Cytophagales bacterium]
MSKLRLSLALVAAAGLSYFTISSLTSPTNSWEKPTNEEYAREEGEFNQEKLNRKLAVWGEQEASRHQELLKKYGVSASRKNKRTQQFESFGSLQGKWSNRAPMNMPAAYKFAEMLDGTDTIYGVSFNHYTDQMNSRSYIWKGTVYNPNTGTKGDDFVCLTPQWPNKYNDLIVFKNGAKTRLIAGIVNGPVYWSEDDGQTWNSPTGLPDVIYSVMMNRQDERVYATNGTTVYVSTDNGNNFSVLQNFGNFGDAVLYSPRYASQPDAEKVYLAREGVFYELNAQKTSFIQKGRYTGGHGKNAFSIGGDSRKLYVTEGANYWVSTNQGTSWTQRYPNGNWYGDREGKMSAGFKLGVSPENPDDVVGGYAQPVFSNDGLVTTKSSASGWGRYQGGFGQNLSDYQDRIRFNYHPDFQTQQFFYNSSNELFYVGSSDGGLFMSYKVWKNPPCDNCGAYDNSGYNGDFINLNTIGMPSSLIYRNTMFTGSKDTRHLVYATQDQGSQDYILGTGGDTLSVYQTIGGDGPSIGAHQDWAWSWGASGQSIKGPVNMYDGNGNRRNISTIRNLANSAGSVEFTNNSRLVWCQVFIDRDEPDQRVWMLRRDLARAERNGNQLVGTTTNRGSSQYQIAAMAQGVDNPEHVFFLKEGKVYKSTNRGDSWDNGTNTPFTPSRNSIGGELGQDIGGGWVLPGNNNWILFAGPSNNSVGAILSKDGGATWTDVTGNFPTGDDFQVGGMVGSPDGQYVFAGTEIGPWVFAVAEEKWYPMYGGGAGMFNTTSIEYIESENLVRFGTWGRGVMEFAIDDKSPKINLSNVASNYYFCDSLIFNWEAANITGSATIELLNNGGVTKTWSVGDVAEGRFSEHLSASEFAKGDNYQVRVSAGQTTAISTVFSIGDNIQQYIGLNIDSFTSQNDGSNDFATNILDGQGNTIWHTEYFPNSPNYPHEFIVKANDKKAFSSMRVLARQDGGVNGRIKDYEVYGSNDGKASWTLLKKGALANNANWQSVDFDEVIECDYIRFVALSEQNNNVWASMAEFELFYEEPCNDLVTSNETAIVKKALVFPTVVNQGGTVSVQGYEGIVEVFTLTGKKIQSVEVTNDNPTFSIDNLNAGIYLVKSVNSNLVQTKIIVR